MYQAGQSKINPPLQILQFQTGSQTKIPLLTTMMQVSCIYLGGSQPAQMWLASKTDQALFFFWWKATDKCLLSIASQPEFYKRGGIGANGGRTNFHTGPTGFQPCQNSSLDPELFSQAMRFSVIKRSGVYKEPERSIADQKRKGKKAAQWITSAARFS